MRVRFKLVVSLEVYLFLTKTENIMCWEDREYHVLGRCVTDGEVPGVIVSEARFESTSQSRTFGWSETTPGVNATNMFSNKVCSKLQS